MGRRARLSTPYSVSDPLNGASAVVVEAVRTSPVTFQLAGQTITSCWLLTIETFGTVQFEPWAEEP